MCHNPQLSDQACKKLVAAANTRGRDFEISAGSVNNKKDADRWRGENEVRSPDIESSTLEMPVVILSASTHTCFLLSLLLAGDGC